MDLYGNFLGGIPYALIGHNLAFTWGLTMLEQDDMDFYRETFDESGKKYFSNGIWFEAHERPESIAVLGGDTVTFVVRSTHHGPIVTDFYDLPENGDPISLWWDYTKYANKLLPAFRLLNHANNISDAEKAASLIHGPGLNLMAADTGGNIGWWACAKLLKRRNHVNSKLILRGTGEDDPLGAYPFSQNPKAINPPWNFVCSANDQPAPMDSLIYPGYYKPSNRADRIKELIVSRNDWTLEDMKDLMTDVTSTVDKQIAEIIAREIGILDDDRLELLADWNGSHEIDEIGPTIYYAVLYQILHAALADEMGDEGFDTFLSTHWMKKCYSKLISNPSNIWWDNTNTQQTETRSEILNIAWKKAVTVLETTFGTNLHEWTWGNAHSLELEHVFGKVSLLRPLFNLSKNATRGGFETINQASFKLNASGKYVTKVGSQMRIIHDLADINKSISISPSGQSGHPMSKHYGDQEKAYRLGLFRPQLRDERKVEKLGNHLRFLSF
jgi:penicillin amidase